MLNRLYEDLTEKELSLSHQQMGLSSSRGVGWNSIKKCTRVVTCSFRPLMNISSKPTSIYLYASSLLPYCSYLRLDHERWGIRYRVGAISTPIAIPKRDPPPVEKEIPFEKICLVILIPFLKPNMLARRVFRSTMPGFRQGPYLACSSFCSNLVSKSHHHFDIIDKLKVLRSRISIACYLFWLTHLSLRREMFFFSYVPIEGCPQYSTPCMVNFYSSDWEG